MKRLHPGKIKSVFTKEGNVYYRLHGADKPVLVKSNENLENIFGNLPTTENATSTAGLGTPATAVDTVPTVGDITSRETETITEVEEGVIGSGGQTP